MLIVKGMWNVALNAFHHYNNTFIVVKKKSYDGDLEFRKIDFAGGGDVNAFHDGWLTSEASSQLLS